MKSRGSILGVHKVGESFAHIKGARLICYRDVIPRSDRNPYDNKKTSRPEEVIVASSNNGCHHLVHLSYLSKGDQYITSHSTAMLSAMHDVLPISLERHCSGDLSNCASLVVIANDNYYSVELCDFTRRYNYEILKSRRFKHLNYDHLPLFRFRLDYKNGRIKLLVHDIPAVKKSKNGLHLLSDIQIDRSGGIIDYKVLLDEVDLTCSLMKSGVNLRKTFHHFPYFTIHYN